MVSEPGPSTPPTQTPNRSKTSRHMHKSLMLLTTSHSQAAQLPTVYAVLMAVCVCGRGVVVAVPAPLRVYKCVWCVSVPAFGAHMVL